MTDNVRRSSTARPAGRDDLDGLARLLHAHASDEERARQSLAEAAEDLGTWWDAHRASHVPFVATVGDEPVGMVWLALLDRVPRPGGWDRCCGDLQTLYVVPEHRGQGLGAALVDAAASYAWERGAERVTVHAGTRSVPLYRRAGFGPSPVLLHRARPQE